MDSGVIADGLRRRGLHRAADDLDQRTLDGCRLVGGFPEFFRGDLDGTLRVNQEVVDTASTASTTASNSRRRPNQGWTATRVWRILRRRGLCSRHPREPERGTDRCPGGALAASHGRFSPHESALQHSRWPHWPCVWLTSAALAGGFAVTTLDPLPQTIQAGQTYRIGYVIRQHGVTPVWACSAGDSHQPRRASSCASPATPRARPATTCPTVTFPSDGAWTWSVDQTPFSPQ